MKRIVSVETATGRVLGEWSGGDEQSLATQAGVTLIAVPNDATAYAGAKRWTGAVFQDVVRVPVPSQMDRLEALLNEIKAALPK